MTTQDDAKWGRRAPLKSRGSLLHGGDALAHEQNVAPREALEALEPEEARTSLEVERFFDLFENRS